MSTLLEPTEGEVIIADYDLKKSPLECKMNIGVVPQEIALYDNSRLQELHSTSIK